jgi:hypothetical protein
MAAAVSQSFIAAAVVVMVVVVLARRRGVVSWRRRQPQYTRLPAQLTQLHTDRPSTHQKVKRKIK